MPERHTVDEAVPPSRLGHGKPQLSPVNMPPRHRGVCLKVSFLPWRRPGGIPGPDKIPLS